MTSTPSRLDLAVALTAYNSMRTIGRALDSVKELARRIVVVDSGSSDGTVEHCRGQGAEVIHRDWQGHVAQKQFAIDQCTTHDHGWVLLLDSDESLEPKLQESVREAISRNDSKYHGWSINRKVWFMNGWLHHIYQPEWRLRLFRRGTGRVAGTDPHDRIEVTGRVGRLAGDLRHDSWADLSEMALRHVRYAEIACRHAASGGSLLNLLLHPPAAMFKQLVLKRGFLDGWRGVVIAAMTANSVTLKHAFVAAARGSAVQQEPTT